jgi:acetyl esterase/lipase
MDSPGINLILELIEAVPRNDTTVEQRRARYDNAEKAFPLSGGFVVETVEAYDVEAELLRPTFGRSENVVLYLHGGGYMLGSPRSHRHLAAAIADVSGGSALLPHYRRAPEHPFPAAVNDAVAAYKWLLHMGYPASSIVIGGDSAGGGLTLACLMHLRDAGVPLPAGAVCISPWVDLTCSSASYITKADRDPLLKLDNMMEMAKAYLGGAEPKTPLASPLYGDFHGLPDVLIHVGSNEVLFDECIRLAEKAKDAGVNTFLEIGEGMIHVWHWYVSLIEESSSSVQRIGDFVRSRTTSKMECCERTASTPRR